MTEMTDVSHVDNLPDRRKEFILKVSGKKTELQVPHLSMKLVIFL